MQWRLCFIFLCASFSVIAGQPNQTDPLQSAGLGEVSEILSTLFGIGSCTGANCGSYETSRDESAELTHPNISKHELAHSVEEYEPQYPDAENSNLDGNETPERMNQHVEHIHVPRNLVTEVPNVELQKTAIFDDDKKEEKICPPTCFALQAEMNRFNYLRPFIYPYKCEVFRNIALTAAELNFKRRFCVPAVRLLDMIIVAATKVKSKYAINNESSCEFSKIPQNKDSIKPETQEYKSADKAKTYQNGNPKQSLESSTSKATETSSSYLTEKSDISTSVSEQIKDHDKLFSEKQFEGYVPTEEIIAEDYDDRDIFSPFASSIRGIPGEHFPNYSEVPVTSFNCAGRKYIPGFYADLETGCQVFHVCLPRRRESFLCPIGTTFNQAILTCDYWYSSNCSLASHYYDVNEASSITEVDNKKAAHLDSMIDILLQKGHVAQPMEPSEGSSESVSLTPHVVDISYILKFLPVRAKVVVYPETMQTRTKIIGQSPIGQIKQQNVKEQKHVTALENLPVPRQQTIPPLLQRKVVDVSTVPLKVKPENIDGNTDSKGSNFIDKVLDIVKKFAREAAFPPTDAEKISLEKPIDPKVSRLKIKTNPPPRNDKWIDLVDQTLKKLLKETKDFYQPITDVKSTETVTRMPNQKTIDALETLQMIKGQVPIQKHLHLTRLNQRFIIKPVQSA